MPREASPRISFVVPCYNYGRFLAECLNSILAQEGVFDFEIIVIDDASTDNTAEVIASFNDRRIRSIEHRINRGHAATIDEGLRMARGMYIARIDPDDRYRSIFLAETIPKLEKHVEVGMVYGDAALIDDRGTIDVERCDVQHGDRDFKGNEFVELLAKNFICAPTVIARREAWLSALPVPEGLAFNDWYFTLMMARRDQFYYVNQVLADYRVHNGNHHTKIALDKTEERSIFRLLDRIFQETESITELEQQKNRAIHRIYSTQYLTLADKYFGVGLDADARRCYLRALQRRPLQGLSLGVLRRLLGTLVGRRAYEDSKAFVKAIISPLANLRR